MTPSELHLEFFLGLSILFNVLLLSVGLLRFIMRSTEIKKGEIILNKLEQKTLEDSCTQLDFNENGGWIDLTTEDHKIIRIYREDIPGLMRFVMEAYFKRYDK